MTTTVFTDFAINRRKSEVRVENTSTGKRATSDATTSHHTSHNTHRPNALKKFVLFLILILPTCIYLAIFVHADVQLLCERAQRLSILVNDYYYHGWPVEDIRFDITQNNRECGLHQYLSSSAKRNQTSIESRLYYVVGSEESAAIDRLMFLSSESSRLYIHGIEQPTSGLEKYFDYAYDALQTESYDDLTSAIAHIAKEQLRLSSMQIDDITLMIAEHEKSIIDMTLIGSFYKLNQQQGVSSVAGIADSRIPLLQKYSEISNVRDTVISSLDQKIVNRGGVVTDGKRIVIAVRKQRLYMIENYRIIYDMPISTGIYGHQTGLGEFQVYEKVPMAWGYYRIWMPYWLTIYYSGDLENGIHGIPISPSTGRWDRWDNAVGNYPITYGCVMPHDWDAKTLFEWAEVGIPVSILP